MELFSGLVGVVLGALLFAGALADGGSRGWLGLVGGPLCAALGWRAVGGLVERAARAARRAARPRCSPPTRTARRCVLAAIAIFVPPASILAIVGFVVLLFGGPAARGREVRRLLRALR